MAASLAGLDVALDEADPAAVELALRRVLLLYSVVFSYGGLPLVYMGDELGLRNDAGYASDPAKAADNRWMHRPRMDWDAAARRHDPATIEGRLFAGIQALITARRARSALHAGGTVEPFDTGNPHVFGYRRELDGHAFTAFANFSDLEQAVRSDAPRPAAPGGRPPRRAGDYLILEPYGFAWIG
jgi:amylosucrase